MFITLTVLLLLILVLGVYVIRPLLQPNVLTSSTSAIGSEDDLRRLLTFRDDLLKSLMGTAHQPSLSPEAGNLSQEQALQVLIRVCEILKNAGLPYLPAPGTKSNNSNGANGDPPRNIHTGAKSPVPQILSFALWTAAASAGLPGSARAQDDSPSRMPPLLMQEDGTALAQIHQFILSPDQGQLRAYYLSLFYTTDSQPLKVRIPSPDNAAEFDFSAMTEALVSPNRAGQPPVLELTPESGINQIRGSFILPATSGAATWTSSFFKSLPGVTLIILPEYGGVLEKVFGEAVTALNIWPPRITQPPAGFEFKRTIEQPNERDPNFSRMKNPPEQHSLHYFRRGDESAPYPEFQVTGIAASRTPGELIIVFFGMMLIGVALYTTFKTNGRPSRTAAGHTTISPGLPKP